MAGLTTAEKAAYQSDGFVVPSFRLPQERIDALCDALDRVMAANPGVRPESLVSIHVEKGAEINGAQEFLDLCRDPEILDLVEDAMGPDIILWGAHMFCKPAGDGLEVPWHQDGHYWPIRPLATCTVWVALERSDEENGCLRVIPGSHQTQALHGHEKDPGKALPDAIEQAAFDEADAVDVVLEPGQMSLHDVFMIHGSNANTSARRRAGLAIRYMPASSLFDREMMRREDRAGTTVDFAQRPIWLLRGEDRTGRNDFSIGHA